MWKQAIGITLGEEQMGNNADCRSLLASRAVGGLLVCTVVYYMENHGFLNMADNISNKKE